MASFDATPCRRQVHLGGNRSGAVKAGSAGCEGQLHEICYADDPHVAKLSSPQQVPVFADDEIGLCRGSALENPVVIRVFFDDVQSFGGRHAVGELLQLAARIVQHIPDHPNLSRSTRKVSLRMGSEMSMRIFPARA
jgi:hypothetical protein